MAFVGKISLKNILQKACFHVLVVVSFLIWNKCRFLTWFLVCFR